jgi:hypothetical protein
MRCAPAPRPIAAASGCYAADQLVPFQCRIWLLLLWSGTSADRLKDPTAQQSAGEGQAIPLRSLFEWLMVPPGLAVLTCDHLVPFQRRTWSRAWPEPPV